MPLVNLFCPPHPKYLECEPLGNNNKLIILCVVKENVIKGLKVWYTNVQSKYFSLHDEFLFFYYGLSHFLPWEN